MPRSARDSDEELDTKHGRKTRALAGSVTNDLSVRRSSRIKPLSKHSVDNESSPDSPTNDMSSVSNTQSTRLTRRRLGTMDSVNSGEKPRALRSRKSSISSDISEITESDPLFMTPTKKLKNAILTPSGDTPKTNARINRRLSRASSEVNSPSPLTRVTRRTRASSMEPEGISDIRSKEKTESLDVAIKTRRRASVFPLEATLIEEKEAEKVLVVQLDRSLPGIDESVESVDSSTKSRKSLSRKNKLSMSPNTTQKVAEEEEKLVEGLHDTPPENVSSNTLKNVVENTSVDEAKVVVTQSETETVENSETTVTETDAKETEHSVQDTSPTLSKDNTEETPKELELKSEIVLNLSEEEQEKNTSNKENETANIISETTTERNKEIRLLAASPVLLTKSIKDKHKSVTNEAIVKDHHHSKELPEVVSETVLLKETVKIDDTANQSGAEKMEISIEEIGTDSHDNTQTIALNNETDSLNKTVSNESATKDVICEEMSTTSNSSPNDKPSDDNDKDEKCAKSETTLEDSEATEQEEAMDISCSNSATFDNTNSEMDVSTSIANEAIEVSESTSEKVDNNAKTGDSLSTPNINESTDVKKDEKQEEETVNQSKTEDNKSEIEETIELTSQNVTEKNVTDSTIELSLSDLSGTTAVKSSDLLLTKSQSSIILEDESPKNNAPNIDNALSDCVSVPVVSESSNCSLNPKDSTSTNKNEDDVIDIVKDSQSSTVTESSAEPIEELPHTEEQSENASLQDSSLTPRRKSVNKSQLTETEQVSESHQKAQKQNEEGMESDDNNSEVAAENLFQDIPADEWKEKSLENDSVESVSAERLENESEAECDLILVDREAWLAAESLKAAKEKEVFDYDSDDTVVLKSRTDSLKSRDNEKKNMSIVKEEQEMNVTDTENTKASSKRKSILKTPVSQKEEENITKDVTGVEDKNTMNKSTSEERDADNLNESKLNTSSRKSIEGKESSKSKKTKETEENGNKSFTESKLNRSKLSANDSINKKRSLDKSDRNIESATDNITVHNIPSSQSEEESCEIKTKKKRKSLNDSKTKISKVHEPTDSDSTHAVLSSAKKGGKNQSLDTPLKKRVKPKLLDMDLSNESDNESRETDTDEKVKDVKKKKKIKNYSTVVNVESNSEDDRDSVNSDSNDSKNETIQLPNFLFAGVDSNDSSDEDDKSSNKSIDSDIQREYNLDGNSMSKFSDDDVPGDECRASESEFSDPDDNGSDLADFVVDDDEVEEEEDENEESENKSENDEEDENENEEGEEDNEENIETEGEDEEMEECAIGDVIKNEHEDSEEENKLEEENDIEEDMETEEVDVETDICDINLKPANKSLETSKKEKSKKNDVMDTSLSELNESGKKKKKTKLNTSQREEATDERRASDGSFSNSFKTKKLKQKLQDSHDVDQENREEELNESEVVFNKNIKKLNKSIKCSTPKMESSKVQVLEMSAQILDASMEKKRRKSVNKTTELINESFPKKGRTMDTSLRAENISKKVSKVKNKEANLMHKSLPTDLIDLVETTNLSRPMSSKVTELNKTTLAPTTETPTTKYLKKDKLNESAPILKLRNEFKKSRGSVTDEQNNSLIQLEEEEVHEESTQQENTSLKRNILKVADSILDTDRQKKHKKRKRLMVENMDTSLLNEDNSQESVSQTVENKDEEVDSHVTNNKKDEQESCESLDKKKKRKKKKKAAVETPEPVSQEEEMNTEVVHEKKKNKKNKNVSEFVNTAVENLERAKKKVQVEAPETQSEPVEKSSKKKHKLAENVTSKLKVTSGRASKKLQQSNDTVSDSDEAPEAVAFSKAREEALEVIKRTTDSIKANKEMKKKKQMEHMDKMQKEKEIKMQKIESRHTSNVVNKVEVTKKGIKRLPDEILENLSDVPSKALKKRKLLKKEEQVLPSRSMFDSKITEVQNVRVENSFIPLSSCGGTTQFEVVNLRKIKKQKKVPAVASFRQRMFARNSRQPVSAYLMYLEKQKATGKAKFSNKPF